MKDHKSHILVQDTRQDERYQFWSGADNVRSWIGAPLLVAQKMIGYLTVDRYLAGAFNTTDANLVQAFAHQVAQTIHNAQLFADLREVQTQLIQRERLAALGQMAATVAHELRNPLMAIRMGVEYLTRDLPEDDSRRRGAALMQANMDRIDRIVEDILYVARAPRPNLAPGYLGEILETETGQWELSISEKNIDIKADLAAGLAPILLDADQIGRLLSNLIGNSIDAVGPGGEINLTLRGEDNNQIVTISDNGPGISEEHQQKIFEPFFTTKSRGTGLGLAIVKQIIDYHQGQIWVKSELGVGTTFTITLPHTENP
jgi:two-component system sensor histidine kinase HydH